MENQYCAGCGLPESFCCCSTLQPAPCDLLLVLLLHENEPSRPSSTSRIIQQVVQGCKHYIWERRLPPEDLLELINNPTYQPWLLFPEDRPVLAGRSRPFQRETGRTPLVIVPDGTWKEVRKIVRKSPWLDHLPLLSFTPENPTRYKLRRNPDEEHLCTAETVAELLRATGNEAGADSLEQGLDHFLNHYKQWKQGPKEPQH